MDWVRIIIVAATVFVLVEVKKIHVEQERGAGQENP